MFCVFLQNDIILGTLLVILLFSSITKGELLPSRILSLQEIHLVRSLTYISQRYFAPERTVVLSSPAAYRDVQQELITEIHRNSIWPVVVTVGGNISKPHETDRIGSYFILLPDGNFKSFDTEINRLADGQSMFERLWNSEARFVVAGANEFSMSQQKAIFDYFSNIRIYNCIIISREHYDIDKEYSSRINVNDVETGMKFGVYTWFPYQSSDRCAEVNDITLLDSWVISAQGHFTKKTDLFPRKISYNLNGCPMKAVVRESYSDFTTYYEHSNFSNDTVFTKANSKEMDLLQLVLKQMNMTFIHVPPPEGFEIEKGLTDNLTRAMIAKDAYIALGAVGTRDLFDPFLDSTNTYYVMSFSWYVPCSVKYTSWSSIFRVLSGEVWLVLIISIVIVAISITLVGRYSCTSEWQVYKTLTSSLTNVWAVILGVAVSTMPRAPSLRSLFLAWMCFSVAFSTVFQAFLKTFLVGSSYKTPIRNKELLHKSGSKLYYILDVDSEILNASELSKLEGKFTNCPSYRECMMWAKNHKNVSILLSDLDMELFYTYGYMLDENHKPLMCRLQDGLVYSNGLRMKMFHGDPLMRRVTEIIDRVVEAGLYNYWISQEFYTIKLLFRKIAIVHPLDGYYSFSLYHMQPAFYLLLMGWCLSVLCFMVELLYNRVLRKRN